MPIDATLTVAAPEVSRNPLAQNNCQQFSLVKKYTIINYLKCYNKLKIAKVRLFSSASKDFLTGLKRTNMSNDLNSYLPTPTKQRFAATFQIVRRISFWVQLGLGTVSGLALLLAIFSRNITVQTTTNPVMGLGVVLGIIGILALCIRIYWANRYRRLDKVLQSPNRELHPKKEDVIQALRTGLIVSLIGLVLAFLASEVTVIAVLSKALALPQSVAVYRPENVIRSLDIFIVLANVNLIGAHLVGSATSLGLLNWLDQ